MSLFQHRYRWIICIITLFGGLINYIDRSAFALAIHFIQHTFQFDNADFGLLLSAFGLGYFISTFASGALIEYFGSYRVVLFAAISWSLACGILALSTNFPSLLIGRVLLGLAEGPCFPALWYCLTLWLPKQELSKGLSISITGIPLAAIIGSPFIGFLLTSLNWRSTFIVLMIIGLIWAFIWYRYVTPTPDINPRVGEIEKNILTTQRVALYPIKTSLPKAYASLIKDRTMIVNYFGFFTFGCTLSFCINWLPGYFLQTFHVSTIQVGWLIALCWSLALITLLLGGYLSDKIWIKTQNLRLARSHLLWSGQLFIAISLLICGISTSLTLSVICLIVAVSLSMFTNGVFNTVCGERDTNRGIALGLHCTAGGVAGLLTPWTAGVLSSTTGSFLSAFLLLSGLLTTSSLLIFLFHNVSFKDLYTIR